MSVPPEELELLTDDDITDFHRMMLESTEDGGFEVKFEDEATGRKVETKPLENSCCLTVRAQAILPCRPKFAYRMSMDMPYHHTYDTMCDEWYVVQKIDQDRDICHYVSKSPLSLIVSPRDFVLTRIHKRIPGSLPSDSEPTEEGARDDPEGVGTYILLQRSIVHPEVPERDGVIRAESHFTCFYLEAYRADPSDETSAPQTVLRYMANADSKGSVPTMLVDFLAIQFAPRYMSNLVDAVSAYPAWKAEQKRLRREARAKREEEARRRAAGETEGETQEEEGGILGSVVSFFWG